MLLPHINIVWKVSKYGPEITPYFDTFHTKRNTGRIKYG